MPDERVAQCLEACATTTVACEAVVRGFFVLRLPDECDTCDGLGLNAE
jgi:hypothetical protein